MAKTPSKVPVKTEKTPASPPSRHRFEGVRREMGSLVEDFFGRRPSSSRRHSFLDAASRRWAALGAIPAVHLTETDKAYEITSKLPSGMDERNVEVTFAKGVLTINGEKQEEREERKKGYHMRENCFGSFERTLEVSEDIDTDNVRTSFKKGRLILILPKRAEAQAR